MQDHFVFYSRRWFSTKFEKWISVEISKSFFCEKNNFADAMRSRFQQWLWGSDIRCQSGIAWRMRVESRLGTSEAAWSCEGALGTASRGNRWKRPHYGPTLDGSIYSCGKYGGQHISPSEMLPNYICFSFLWTALSSPKQLSASLDTQLSRLAFKKVRSVVEKTTKFLVFISSLK